MQEGQSPKLISLPDPPAPQEPAKEEVKKPEEEKAKSNAGRKLFDGKDEVLVVTKLEEAFAIGCTDEEACFYAEISRSALFRYMEDNEEFRNRRNALKQKPILKARKTLYDDLDKPDSAMWFLERKLRDEFSPKQIIDNKSADADKLDSMRQDLNKLMNNAKTEAAGDAGEPESGEPASV